MQQFPHKIVVASDHAGFALKEKILKFFQKEGIAVEDLGCPSTESVDYPDYAEKVALQVSRGEASSGILVCGTGIGMAIAANKFKGVRAAPVCDVTTARLVRQHNNANVLCLGGRLLTPSEATGIVSEFLKTPFEGGRHEQRVKKISEIETKK